METELLTEENKQVEINKFISRVYGWMFIALLVSGAAALYTAKSAFLTNLLFSHHMAGMYTILIVEFLLVFMLSAFIKKCSVATAYFFFFLYSVINGITLSCIFLAFDKTTISLAFFISAGMFGAMTLYGMKTSQDLRPAARYLMMIVVGLIIASMVNIIFKSGIFEWIITLVTLVVFIGLTAYDTQKIIKTAQYSDDSDDYKKAAVLGALELYLDFINIFLSLLRLFNKRR